MVAGLIGRDHGVVMSVNYKIVVTACDQGQTLSMHYLITGRIAMQNIHQPTAYLTFRAEGANVEYTVPCYSCDEVQARYVFWNSLSDAEKAACDSVELVAKATIH